MSVIKDKVEKLLASLPPAVTLMAVVKTRSPGEVTEAVDAGVRVIGGNYVQETASLLDAIGRRASCHLIGHLQRNKAGKAAELFDCIETVDSMEIAAEIDRRCSRTGKIMPVLIEVNSGREPNKSGVMPEDAESLAASVAGLNHVKIRGLMTMGPFFGDPEESRPCFRETKRIFDLLSSAGLSNVEMSVLSMGMSHSYRVAVEEGATLVRIGTGIFGERK